MDPLTKKLDAALRQSEPVIGDGDFSARVMSALPRRRPSRDTARRWTLGGAAALGSVLTSVLGAPLEEAFSRFVLEGGIQATGIGIALFIGLIAIPVAWLLYSR